MRKIYLIGLIFVTLILCITALGQTNPTAQTLPYSFTTLSGTTLPTGMAAHRFGTTAAAIPSTRTTIVANGDLPNASGNSGGWAAEAANGISLLASSNQSAGAIVVSIVTTGKTNIQISWKGGTILQQASYDNSIALQYRIGTSGTWADIGTTTTYTTAGKIAGDISALFTENLPAAAENQPVVQVRWIYWASAGSSGSRDRINIDEISIATAATSYTVTYNGNGNTGGTPPSDANTYSSGSTITVLGNTGALVRAGYTFDGWATSAGGAVAYTAGSPFPIFANTTLYAHWYDQTIWSNPITGTNPSSSNPYFTGQAFASNITVSGIGFTGVTNAPSTDRYSTSSWPASFSTGKYFSFTLTPGGGYSISFISFIFSLQSSNTGPASYSLRSSVDGFATNITNATTGVQNATNNNITISLSASQYQNIQVPVEFRIYGYNAGGGTFSVNDFSFKGTINATSPCSEPTAQTTAITLPTSLAANAQTTTSGSFTKAASEPNYYLVLVSPNNSLATADKPVDGSTYAAGNAIGAATVVSVVTANGSSSYTFNATGLTAGTQYYYYVISFNTGSCAPNYYLPASITSGMGTTRPNIATNFRVVCQSSNSATLEWSAPSDGGYDGYIIVARQAGSANLAEGTYPPSSIGLGTYAFGAGSPTGTGSFAVYKGSATTVTVTGLTAGQTYSFLATAYKNESYSSTSAPTASISNLAVPDVTGFGVSTTTGSASLSWSNPNAGCYDEILVVANLGTVSFTPSGDGTAYTANSVYTSANQVVYKGTGNLTTVTTLTTGLNYCFKVFVRKGTGWSAGQVQCVTIYNGTTLKTGELVLTAFDANVGSSADRYVIATFADITKGTSFSIVNSRYEAGASANVRTNRWGGASNNAGGTPGVLEITYTGNTTIPAGSIININTGVTLTDATVTSAYSSSATFPGTDFTLTVPLWSGNSPNISSSAPDQIFLVQGEFYLDNTTATTGVARYILNGKALFGISSGADWVTLTSANSGGTADANRTSRLPFEIECFNYSSGSANKIAYAFYKNSSAPAPHSGTPRILLNSLRNTAGTWTVATSGSSGEDLTLDATSTLATDAGAVFTITPGNPAGTWVGDTNENWFECSNWEGLAVPDSTIDVTIPSSATNSSTIDIATYGAKSVLYGNQAYSNNIVMDGKTLNITASSPLNVGGDLTIMNGGKLNMVTGTVFLDGAWTNSVGSAGFTSGSGTINYKGDSSQTIAPENYYNLTSTSTGARVMSSTGTVGISNIFTKGTNVYVFTGSTVDYNGSEAQSIVPFTSSQALGGYTYNNLTLSNGTSIKSLTGNTDVEGDFTLNNSITFKPLNSYLRIRSLATKTGRVAPVSSAASIDYSGGSGRFVIERYFPARRSWRLITAPVIAEPNQSVFDAWQQGGGAFGTGVTGSGTYVTGPEDTDPNSGLDVSPMHNYSLKTFNQSTSQWVGVSNTKTQKISGITNGNKEIPGFFMFIRGDRASTNPQAYNPAGYVVETTLRDTGKIQVFNYSVNCNTNTATGLNYTLVGNPYASAIDFSSLSRNNVANKFWAWDPKLNGFNGVGGFVVVDLQAGSIITVPSGGSTTQNKFIQSKQAFLVETTAGSSPAITFNEGLKSSDDNLDLFRPSKSDVPSLGIDLYIKNNDGSKDISDGVLTQFDENYSDQTDYMDALKFGNINESFSISRNKTLYMLERRQPLKESDTIYLNFKKSRRLSYQFNVFTKELGQRNLAGYLEDNFQQTSTPINMNGNIHFDFAVTGAAGSADANRFRIVFKKAVQYTRINAAMLNSDVVIDWSLINERDMSQHEVERSVDGIHFTGIGTVNSKGNSAEAFYSLVDLQPATGMYYYRIKSTGLYGAVAYSEAVTIKVVRSSPGIYVFPNPVTDDLIHLQLNMAKAGSYHIRLLNALGQELLKQNIAHPGGNATHSITRPQVVARGTYSLEVLAPGNRKTVLKILIQ